MRPDERVRLSPTSTLISSLCELFISTHQLLRNSLNRISLEFRTRRIFSDVVFYRLPDMNGLMNQQSHDLDGITLLVIAKRDDHALHTVPRKEMSGSVCLGSFQKRRRILNTHPLHLFRKFLFG